MKQTTKRKLIYSAIFAALLVTEILIGKYAHGFVRAYIGDVLVMPTMYFFVRIFTEKFPRTLPLILFIFACAVEVSQYFELYKVLGFAPGSLPAILIGTGFAWEDILAYAVGSLLNAVAAVCFKPARTA
ncbi:MAG: DUF2809 domain-containing protein [Ruminococcus sp.]|uniref:DUF2809 domain-containing protein n=1 Tax=Ruminococcus albus TaxID=1264 RepID=A0A1H7P0R6_RUMAL|nr:MULTISPECIES: DUF2809 domain-containing protein [Ruminococcus]MBO4865240.1 DUF2809 domain-containing protein [Ruminococcus sp.]SEL29460.1 Protein of unknown function [Ruminococcus albus]